MISAVIITWNGEETIADCIESIAPHVGEIIVVLDSKTTDNTEAICRHYTDKIYTRDWNNNYADARNYGIEKATGDWILTIDTDETLVKWEQPDNDYDFYWFEGLNPLPDGFITTSRSIRLFKNNGIKYYMATHEQLFKDGKNIAKDKIRKGKLSDGVILHKEKNIEDVVNKTKGLLEMALDQKNSEPDNVFLRGQIGGYYGLLGDKIRGLANLFFCILLDDVSPNSKAGAALQIARILEDYDSEYQDALELSLKLCPQQISANAVLHEINFEAGKKEAAEHYKNKIQQVGRNSLLPYDMSYESVKIYQ